jgi:hypothetical protein
MVEAHVCQPRDPVSRPSLFPVPRFLTYRSDLADHDLPDERENGRSK